MPAITREYLDALAADPFKAQGQGLILVAALLRVIDVRDAAITRGLAAEAEVARGWGKVGFGTYMTVIDADEITAALDERNV